MKPSIQLVLALLLQTGTYAQVASFPPDGTTLVGAASSVRLHWLLSNSSGYRAEVIYNGHSIAVADPLQGTNVPLGAGGTYRWVLYHGRSPCQTGGFGVAQEAAFHADGPNGPDGASGRLKQDGVAGGDGGVVSVMVSRSADGVLLDLESKNHLYHYLVLPGARFLITARGGNGGKGGDGQDGEPETAAGGNGGNGGWGGTVHVVTRNFPWRECLDIDVSPGKAGSGGKSGTVLSGTVLIKIPNGQEGRPGQSGKVETRIGE
ncbi:hypothetical protein JST97_18820 [bacterium]|nr:hypothetical protein [bacterium]